MIKSRREEGVVLEIGEKEVDPDLMIGRKEGIVMRGADLETENPGVEDPGRQDGMRKGAGLEKKRSCPRNQKLEKFTTAVSKILPVLALLFRWRVFGRKLKA